MKGLLLKDLLNLKKQVKLYVIFIIFYMVLSITSKDTSFVSGIICVFCAMLPMTALSYDERASWDKYALSMPITRKNIVISKYILGLLCSVIGAIITLTFNFIISGYSYNSIILTLIFWGLSILFMTIIFPILFKFGVEKGRLVMMLVLFAPAMIGTIFVKLDFFRLNEKLVDSIIKFAPIIIIAVVLASLLISITISLRVYSKKEL